MKAFRTLQNKFAQKNSALQTLFKPSASTAKMIRRELVADIIQNPLKAMAAYQSGSMAVLSELMRAFIDFLNHLVMLGADIKSQKPANEHYNYGFEKIKNFAVLFPGICFFGSGVLNLSYPIWSFLSNEPVPELTLGLASMTLICATSFGEFYLFYKNLGDISKDMHLPFYKKLALRCGLSYNVIMKKKSIDAIQDAIITENVLAVMGVVTPIVTTFACKWTGLFYFDLIGQMINGNIQIYLGYLIVRSNLSILAGKSIDMKTKQEIIEKILEKKEILRITDFKTEFTGDESVRLYLKIKHNSQYIGQNLVAEFEKDILRLTEDPEKIKLVKKLMMDTVVNYDEIVDLIISKAENKIVEEFPDAKNIDLELSESNIIRGVDVGRSQDLDQILNTK